MVDGQAALVVRIDQVGIEGRQLMRREQALVHQGAAGHRRDVEALVHEASTRGIVLDAFSRQVQGVFEAVEVASGVVRRDQCLADPRQCRARSRAELVGVDRDVAPAEEPQPSAGNRASDDLFAFTPITVQVCLRQEAHGHTEQVGRVQSTEPQAFCFAGE